MIELEAKIHEANADYGRLANMLKGNAPKRRDGTRPSTAKEWLEETWELIKAEVDADPRLGVEPTRRQLGAKRKALTIRYWNSKTPPASNGNGRPGQTFDERDEATRKSSRAAFLSGGPDQ